MMAFSIVAKRMLVASSDLMDTAEITSETAALHYDENELIDGYFNNSIESNTLEHLLDGTVEFTIELIEPSYFHTIFV